MKKKSVLFILKQKKLYDIEDSYAKVIHSGLFNSASFVNNMLNEYGIESNLVQVIDNNCIDKFVTKYKPTDVIIEAIWVVPEKFEVLAKLHPDVRWIIRLHSELPFIAGEGNAISWVYEYSRLSKRLNIAIAPNTPKMYNDLKSIGINNLMLLPNYYPASPKRTIKCSKKHIDVGCFGAIRPMKNQLIQAVAAIDFANKMKKKLRFHMNVERVENGDNALKNIKALFANQPKHELVEHPWYSHGDFIQLIRTMDMGLQVSFNETFNIVAADFVSCNVPLVGSEEIIWLNDLYKTKTTCAKSIASKMYYAYMAKKIGLQALNFIGLAKFVCNSQDLWLGEFNNKPIC